MAVNVKMGVDIGGFTAGIKQGQQILKGLNAEMKVSESEFKATGNAEQKLTSQTKTLTSQLNVQKGIADQAAKALKTMTDSGIKPTDAAYQKMYVTMLNAEAGANEAQAALNNLGSSAGTAAGNAEKLANSMNGISKKISLDQVIGGIKTITDGLEKAAQKAVSLGEEIWNSIMDSARWADDTATMAQMYGITVDRFQRMQKLVTNGMDTSVDSMLKAQSKLRKGIGDESKAVIETLDDLKISVRTLSGDEGVGEFINKDQLELFWEAGQAIANLADENKQESAAQALFGKGWRELSDLFDKYKTVEEYEEALKGVKVVSDENIKAGTDLNDKISELKGNFETLKNEVLLSLAPALTDAATALNGVLESVLEYLQKDEGKAMLKQLGDSVAQLFDGVKNIDAKDVVENFKKVFEDVESILSWIVKNKDSVVTAIEAVFGFWATFQVGSGVTTLIKMFDGLKSLFGFGAGGGAATGGGGTGLIGGGGWLTALNNWVTGGVSGLASGLTQFTTQGGGFIVDWLMHESPLGSIFQGTESLGDWWDRQVAEFNQRKETFDQDWRENKLFGWAVELGENSIRFWDNFWNGGDKEDLQNRADEFLKDMGLAVENEQPVNVPAEMIPEDDAAEKLSAMVGVVPIQAELVGITGGGGMGMFRGMPTGGAGGGGLPHYKKGYANGLSFVPNDGLYMLHRGERVTPAREIASRNFSSNLYVESMYMNNGTDAAGLAAAMAAAQRRTMSGYGS